MSAEAFGIRRKVHWGDLSESEQELFSLLTNGCGGTDWQAMILERFYYGKLFRASCVHHDWNFKAGGSLWDFLKANWDMLSHSVNDALEQRDIGLFIASWVYYLAVSTLGVFYFHWGAYKTKDEIFAVL